MRVAEHDVRRNAVARRALLAPGLERGDELGGAVRDVGRCAARELRPAAVAFHALAVGDHDARAVRVLEHRRVGPQLDDRTARSGERHLHTELGRRGIDVLYHDLEERPGAKFAVADLIGIPWQILVGPRSLAEGKVELKQRLDGSRELVAPAEAVERLSP